MAEGDWYPVQGQWFNSWNDYVRSVQAPTLRISQGWQCPVCGKVMSPFTSECVNDHSQSQSVSTPTIQIGEPFVPPYTMTSGSTINPPYPLGEVFTAKGVSVGWPSIWYTP